MKQFAMIVDEDLQKALIELQEAADEGYEIVGAPLIYEGKMVILVSREKVET